jgi:hypothetical protein
LKGLNYLNSRSPFQPIVYCAAQSFIWQPFGQHNIYLQVVKLAEQGKKVAGCFG